MSRGAGNFTQSEIKAAVKAVIDAGMEIGRVEIGKDGKIIIYSRRGDASNARRNNEWDEVFDGAAAASIR